MSGKLTKHIFFKKTEIEVEIGIEMEMQLEVEVEVIQVDMTEIQK